MAADWRDWEIDEIPEWQAAAQNVLLFVIGSLVLVGMLFLLILPLKQDVDLARQEESLLRTQFRDQGGAGCRAARCR